MASVVGIVNRGLRAVGAENTITALTDGTRNANVASDLYEEHRDNLLRGHPWNFATKRIKLARSATTPVYGWDYQYPVPSDFLRLLEVHDNSAGVGILEYKYETDATDGRVIRANADEVWLKYVAQITDPNQMPPDFRMALSMSLAVDFSIAITNSNSLEEIMRDRYTRAVSRAKSNDSVEDFPDRFPAGSWASSRFSDFSDSDSSW